MLRRVCLETDVIFPASFCLKKSPSITVCLTPPRIFPFLEFLYRRSTHQGTSLAHATLKSALTVDILPIQSNINSLIKYKSRTRYIDTHTFIHVYFEFRYSMIHNLIILGVLCNFCVVALCRVKCLMQPQSPGLNPGPHGIKIRLPL